MNEPAKKTPQEEKPVRDLDPNVRQRRASAPDQSVWVGASAGTGKTKVLTDRVLRLLLPRQDGAAATEPHRILCLTFTKAAASEMLQRVNKILAQWAVADDAVLEEDLRKLSGQKPTAEQMQAARRLFAAVVDTPGGLKIMTIHAFCQSVLGRFPLEADLSPQFKVIDESQAHEALARARDRVLEQARENPESELGTAFLTITALQNEEQFGKLLSGLCGERLQLRKAIENDDFEEKLLNLFALSADETEQSIMEQFCSPENYDAQGLYNACTALANGSKTDKERGLALQLWLDAKPAQKITDFDAYKKLFLTNENEIRARLATKGVIDSNPAILDSLTTEAQRIIETIERRSALLCAKHSHALLLVGKHIISIYEAYKREKGYLDYDDLIMETLSLLDNKAMTPWVLYKLDGGLDHILVDEAQDTNPEQWQIISKLCEDFFSGEGVRDDIKRTIFTVGDEKQSIYSFQRAAPEEFEKMRRFFEEKAKTHEEKLDISFRTVTSVLSVVDETFRPDHLCQGMGEKLVEHHSFRRGQAGHVELWPLCEPDEEQEEEPWTPPVKIIDAPSGQAKLAERIGETIKGWLDNKEIIPSLDRAVEPGDIMILVRTRTAFLNQIVRALKTRNIPVSGIDRMVLGEQIAVMDLLALARFTVLPHDDLSLACVLKSPLIGLNEDALYALANGRKGSLWEALQQTEQHQNIADWLRPLIETAKTAHPYEFFASLLQRPCPAHDVSGLCAMTSRLGEDALDPLDEFLNTAIHFEQDHIPSLQNFLLWSQKETITIKREMEEAGKAVRIMTVHGSKGLQAPIVILPDTTRTPSSKRLDNLLWPDKTGLNMPLWAARSSDFPPLYRQARDRLDNHMEQEYRRLLYVAMTRAEDRLYVCGYKGKKEPIQECWYNYVDAALDRMDDIETSEDGAKKLTNPQTKDPDRAKEQKEEAIAANISKPAWLYRKAPAEPFPPRPLIPSRPDEPEPAMRSPLDRANEQRFKRGNITHKLLQILPDLPPQDRRKAAQTFAAQPGHELSQEMQTSIINETLDILESPEFSTLFAEGSLAEVSLTGLVNGKLVSAQIDRLLITENEVKIVDYKTNRPPPEDPANVPDIYRDQLSAYRDIISAIHPGKPITCYLLWTDGPTLMEIKL